MASRGKLLLTLINTIILMMGPASCLQETCEKAPPYFAIHGIDLYNTVLDGTEPYSWRLAGEEETVPWTRFFMRVGFKKTYHSQIKAKGGQNLYALSCIEPGGGGSQTGMDTIYFVALHDYNAEHLANDTLNSIVLTNYWTSNMDDFQEFFPLSQYLDENKEHIYYDGFDIRVAEPPAASSTLQQFKIVFRLANGETFEATSQPIRLSL